MEFSDDIKKVLEEHFPGKDIYNMSLEELKDMKEEVTELRQEYFLLEMGMKTLGNAAYGASANQFFYFFNVSLAGDITGECRNLTKTMWDKLEYFFHETLWERKDLQEQFNFELDESKHDWYRKQHVSIYSDTDSVYTTFGTLFQAMTPESQARFDTDEKKLQFVLDFNKKFLDKQNNQWCDEMYNPRHGHNIHEFELETVSRSGIYLKKKKYLKGLVFSKGNYYLDKPKTSGTGIEIIKSTTPKLCRKILTDLMKSLMFEFDDSSEESRKDYIRYFKEKIKEYRREFFMAPEEDVSGSIGIGNYKKYVINDVDTLALQKGCPVSVQAIARFNQLAHKHNEDNKKVYSGKIKYYCITTGTKAKDIGYFGFPAGELPTWAPPINRTVQWEKTIVDPINRFLEVMNIPLVNAHGVEQGVLDFGM